MARLPGYFDGSHDEAEHHVKDALRRLRLELVVGVGQATATELAAVGTEVGGSRLWADQVVDLAWASRPTGFFIELVFLSKDHGTSVVAEPPSTLADRERLSELVTPTKGGAVATD